MRIIEENERCIHSVEVSVKHTVVHGALDAANTLAHKIAENRNKILSVTDYRITNAEPTGVKNEWEWTFIFS